MIPIVVGALGMVTRGFKKRQEQSMTIKRIKTIQTKTLLKIVKILRKILVS